MKCIVYERAEDGGVCVVKPIPNARRIYLSGSPARSALAYEVFGQGIARFLAAVEDGKVKFAETEAAFLKRCAEKAGVPPGAVILSASDLPARDFRDAWTLNGKRVVIDMAKARDIVRKRIREPRDLKLVALDIEYVRADERGDTEAKKAVAANKQRLRDLTADPRISAASTPEALRGVAEEIIAEVA